MLLFKRLPNLLQQYEGNVVVLQVTNKCMEAWEGGMLAFILSLQVHLLQFSVFSAVSNWSIKVSEVQNSTIIHVRYRSLTRWVSRVPPLDQPVRTSALLVILWRELSAVQWPSCPWWQLQPHRGRDCVSSLWPTHSGSWHQQSGREWHSVENNNSYHSRVGFVKCLWS